MNHELRIASFSLVALAATVGAQAPQFAAPVRLEAGGKGLGENRSYPSPVFHDVDRDGLLDLVVGDLRGKITVALRQKGEGPARYAAETKLLAKDGKELDFANW